MEKKLHRDEHHKVIGGVCAGLAEYFGMDVAIIRAIFLVTLLLKGGGVLIYFILWMALPKKGLDFTPGVDYRVPPQQDPFNPFAGAPQNQPFNQPPFVAPPKKHASTFGLVFGVALILIGGICLLNELDLMPDWDFENFWPIALVAGGIALIASGFKKQPWEKQSWQNADAADAEPAATETKEETQSDNTPPTI
ncbi:PspC domain-containing protein [Mucilaginibacter celer]|uniref:PspC domain-containing protein n=1 Tax=Mucilaginibacter celer TaxID=2305508 RepID=A0A494VWW0_9SPHI|nr:PspC domain-containing protein [Mucilaginibacter celer]AYL98879.1 PspC domain-containing protein [Mucilaginibacter celer]